MICDFSVCGLFDSINILVESISGWAVFASRQKKTIKLFIGRRSLPQLSCSIARPLSRVNKNHHLIPSPERVLDNLVANIIHSLFDIVPFLNVAKHSNKLLLERHGPMLRPKEKETPLGYLKELGDILVVWKRCREAHDS
jgi:hypothetical protein